MAIDGVAPRAKMNQQRSRRFRSALEAEKLKAEAAAKGEPEAAGEPFDSNCITPGTPFMQRLSAHLKFYVQKKQTEDPLWQKATVILSGHEVRGEGEHKIMEHIRWARGEPGWDPNQTHCLYGLDADLIMLALVTHEPHFCLLREVVKFGAGANSGQPSRETLQNPTDDGFLLLHVGLLREYLDQEFKGIAPALPFKYDCERIVDDFVLLSMLVGNDFLPPLPTLDIAEGALNVLFSTYRELLPTLGGYVSGDDGGGTFNAKRLETILDVMGEMEANVLADRSRDAQANEERQARKASGGRGFGGRDKNSKPDAKKPSEVDDRFKRAMAALADGAGADDAVAAALKPDAPLEPTTTDENSGISADPTMMSAAKREMFEEGGGGIDGWKEMYYREKLGLKIGEAPPLADLRQAYFEGLSWVLQYYYRGVVSWTWYYPFHYAPMASDLADGLGALTAEFDYGVPFRPFEQLLAVQPPQSSALLPEPFRWLMSAPHSPLAPFFPSELKVDFEGKRNDWEGVVLLPFLDEDLLKSCIQSVPASKLTDQQILRNKPGPLVVFQHNPDGSDAVISTLPKVFAGLHPCKSRALESMPPGEFPLSRKCFGGDDSLLPGAHLGIKRPPGFPTMTTLQSTGMLKSAGVNVFGTASKKESLILRVDKKGDKGLLVGGSDDVSDDNSGAAQYQHLVGQRVHVGWPYLTESVVTAVSDKREKIIQREQHVPHGSAEWGADTQKTSFETLTKKGVDVGSVNVMIHVRVCEGLVRHPDGSLQKRFGKTDVVVPAQLVLATDPSPSPWLAEKPALSSDKSDSDQTGGFETNDYALFLGRSHFGAVATVTGSDARGLEVSVDPLVPCTGVGRRILQGVTGGRYEYLGAIARKVGLSPRALSQLTGPVWIAPTKDCGRFDRIDLGLNLKSAAKGLCVADYSRPGKDGNGWEFSQLTVKLVTEYKKHHPWVFHALMADPDNGFEGLELDVALKHVPEGERLNMLKACKAWINSTDAAQKPLVSKFSKVASEAAIKALHATLGGPSAKTVTPTILEAVSPLLLMRPVTAGETLDLYAGGDFSLGDRVAMVGDGGSPAFGTRGYVVAVHGEACEVLFDTEFINGNSLHGVLPDKRGAMLPAAQLVNLSHPPAMPQLGDAAPDRVVADKKGKVTKGGWDEKKKGGGEGKGPVNVPKGILAMAAALLPGKAGLPSGAGGQPSMPVPGSRGFSVGAGRGRGVSVNAGALPGRTLGKPLPGAIVGSVYPTVKTLEPDMMSMLAGADLKNMLGVGQPGSGSAKPAASNGSVSLADLERGMSGASITKPGPDDPAAFWTMLAGGAPPAQAAPVPSQVTMPPAPKAMPAPKASKKVPIPKGAPVPKPMSLAELEGTQVASVPVPVAAKPLATPSLSLAELEATTASSAPSGGDEDPLAFWATLQAQHRAEAEKLTGTRDKKNRMARGKKE